MLSGTLAGQSISILAAPILARAYSPSDFGVLAVYIAALTIMSVIASMRYEFAIVQATNSCEAKTALHLSFLVNFTLAAGLFFVLLVYQLALIILYIQPPENIRLFYFLPFSFLAIGAIQILNSWHLRNGSFRRIATVVVVQSLVTGCLQIISGLNGFADGLVYGLLVGQLLGAGYLIFISVKVSPDLLIKSNGEKLREVATNYKDLPKYSTVGAFCDSLSTQMPLIFIGNFFGLGVAGLFSMTLKTLNLPIAALSGSLHQILFNKIARLKIENQESIQPFLKKTFRNLIFVMVPFVIIVWSFGEAFFVLVFGEQWHSAGDMARFIVVAVAARFCVSPLSSILVMKANLRLGTLWQICYLLSISSVLFMLKNQDIDTLLLVFVGHEIVMYGIYYLFILKGANRLAI